MSQHISYTSRREEPVYIGFDDEKEKTPKKKNGFGTSATFFGVLGLLSSGLMFPIIFQELYTRGVVDHPPFVVTMAMPIFGAILSLLAITFGAIGIFRSPRRYAVLGIVLGLVPIGGMLGLHHYISNQIHARDVERQAKYNKDFTLSQIKKVQDEIESKYLETGEFPDGIAGNRLTIKFNDAWEKELRYEVIESGYAIRSAGPDSKFETDDDCVRTSTKVFASTNK